MTEGPFIRVLSRREVVTLSFGAMIGWSWVLLTGDWLIRAGTLGAVAAFAVGGLAVIFIALTYAELASAMPEAGGEHVYAKRALGLRWSFVCTWALVMGYVTVPVFESVALPTALEYLFPGMKAGLLWQVEGAEVHASFVALGIVGAVLMTVINILGIKTAAFVQTVVTAMFFVIGVFFLTGAFANGSISNLDPLFVGGAGGMLGVLIMVPALMVGFDVIPQSAEEIDLPFNVIGKLIVISVILAVGWYMVITVGVSMSLEPALLVSSSIATADATSAVWGGRWAGNLLVIGGIGGILTSWNAFIIGGSRVLWALAHSGMLPAVFGRVHPRFHTPHIAILLIGGLSCVSPFFGRTILIWLIDTGSFAIVVAYGMVAVSYLVLRAREPEMPRPFTVRRGRLVGWLAVLMSLGLFTLYLPFSPSSLSWPQEWAMVLGWSVLGVVLWVVTRRRRALE